MNIKGIRITSTGGTTAFIPCDPGKTNDGYHSFDELYDHRNLLFCALLKLHGGWKSRFHDDGSSYDGWFIAGMKLGGQPITYHLPNEMWAICNVTEIPKAPKFDGHTSEDVAARIRAWLLDDSITEGGDRHE